MAIRVPVPESILALADAVARIVREELGPDTRLWVFGSWANGTAVPRSDLDVAVDARSEIPPRRWLQVQERIEDLPTLRSIDILDLQGIDEGFRSRILADGIEL